MRRIVISKHKTFEEAEAAAVKYMVDTHTTKKIQIRRKSDHFAVVLKG